MADTAQQRHARPTQRLIRYLQPGPGTVVPHRRLVATRVFRVLQVVVAGRWRLFDDVLLALQHQPALALMVAQAEFVRYQVVG
ncbi:hypothetical protein D3C80_2061990 [compost metagenome]